MHIQTPSTSNRSTVIKIKKLKLFWGHVNEQQFYMQKEGNDAGSIRFLCSFRPSPKLVLIALQLCRIALPLMTVAECSQITVPSHPSLPPSAHKKNGRSLAADIVDLLLAKLAEYIVPDASQVGVVMGVVMGVG